MNINSKADRLKGGLSKLAQTASKNKDSVSGTIILVKPSDCYEEGNPRTDFDENLVESYADDFLNPSVGQEEAIQLYPADKNGKYRVQHGATRLRSGLIAESKDPSFRLKAIVDENLLKKDDLENYLNRGMNNIKRDNMTLRDRANFIGTYMDKAKASGKSVTQSEVAKRLGLKGGASYISRLLKLRDMTTEMNDFYLSGKIDDLEALATLAEIQCDNPGLFESLVALPDLDRATIRKAKKTGEISTYVSTDVEKQTPGTSANTITLDTANSHSVADHNQIATDDTITTILYVDYNFTTGRVHIQVKPATGGYQAALETIFEHGINEAGDFEKSPVFRTEDEAITHGKSQIRAWAEKVLADQDEVSLEEYQDVASYLQWLEGNTVTSGSPDKQPSRKTKQVQLNAVIFVDVIGEQGTEEGVLLLKVPKENLGAEGDNVKTNGFVYVQIGSEIRVVKDGEFVIKSVSYRE